MAGSESVATNVNFFNESQPNRCSTIVSDCGKQKKGDYDWDEWTNEVKTPKVITMKCDKNFETALREYRLFVRCKYIENCILRANTIASIQRFKIECKHKILIACHKPMEILRDIKWVGGMDMEAISLY